VAVVAAAVGVLATSCYQDFDFTADHKADHVYVEADGDWVNAETDALVLDGQPGDIPVPGDYDGNHLFDTAVVRGGDWIIGTGTTIDFPAPAQLPQYVGSPNPDFNMLAVPGDYDGDGADQPAWYRDTDGTWFIHGMDPIVFGTGPSTRPGTSGALVLDQDFPVPADYDGDGTTDLATFNPRTRDWRIRSSATGSVSSVVMTGNEVSALPVPADYDGVGHAQRATFGGQGWDIEGHDQALPYGQVDGNFPAVADYDGNGHADLSYVSAAGDWKTEGSSASYPVWSSSHFSDQYPLPTGRNLVLNVPRLTFIGACYLDPVLCT
jgi:hypothetical protein